VEALATPASIGRILEITSSKELEPISLARALESLPQLA
jgi:hypothetical protein